ncbi:hypothetical protein EVAR_3723_1 [Eumeta japonica]|uniref:Uncharacterized protein n=1 Tax=Eumeta variegata TaxID=151549 RepID=A0A4C1SRE0_EUMVA|nr:hypothetical protein EVAR_3723_1 [Eumeta japonica]
MRETCGSARPSRKEPSKPDRVTRAFHCNIIAQNHFNVPKKVSLQKVPHWSPFSCFHSSARERNSDVRERCGLNSGGARRRRRRRPPTASRLKGPRKQKSFAYKLLKRGLAKSFAYKLLKRGLANLMSPTSTSGVAPPLGLKEVVVTRVERGMLRRFGHLERMNERRLTKQIYRANVCDGKVSKGPPRKSYADHIGGIL